MCWVKSLWLCLETDRWEEIEPGAENCCGRFKAAKTKTKTGKKTNTKAKAKTKTIEMGAYWQ